MRLKKCIIMHVWDGFWRKVHYNALFGRGKNTEKALNAEALRKDLRKIRGEENIQGQSPATPDGGL
jgi:hypothetical protein